MTHAEEIIRTVAVLIKQGKIVFSRKDVRNKMGLDPYVWLYSYTAIFQSMRIDHPGGAPSVNPKFKGVFKRINRGKFVLTTYGKQIIKEFDC